MKNERPTGELPQQHLRSLVEQTVHANKKASRRAESELRRIIEKRETNNVIFTTIQLLQETIVTASTFDQIKQGFQVLEGTLDILILPSGDESVTKIKFSDTVVPTISTIENLDKQIREKRHLERHRQPAYLEFTQQVLPQMQQFIKENEVKRVNTIEHLSPRRKANTERATDIGDVFLGQGGFIEIPSIQVPQGMNTEEWAIEMDKHAFDQTVPATLRLDRIVTFLKNQPLDHRLEQLFSHTINGVSLAVIEKMSYPLTSHDARSITSFLTAGRLKKGKGIESIAGNVLMFSPEVYEVFGNRPLKLENFTLLRNLQAWREQFWYHLLFDEDKRDRQKNLDLLRSIDSEGLPTFVTSFFIATGMKSFFQKRELHQYNPFFMKAMQEHAAVNSLINRHHFTDEAEVWADANEKVFFPKFKQVLVDNGYEKELSALEEKLEEERKHKNYWMEIQMANIDALYKKYISPSLMEYAAEHKEEIEQESTMVWQSISEEGVDFLPLEHGVDIIHFTKHSIPYKMGVSKISLNRQTKDSSLPLNIRFDFIDPEKRGNPLYLIGVISKEGELQTKISLKQNSPGVQELLGLLAVLTYKDLTYQQVRDKRIRSATQRHSPDVSTEKDHEGFTTLTPIPRVRTPYRHQTNEMLRESVTPKVRVDPRRIGVHKMTLHGIEEYEQALEGYKQTRNIQQLVTGTKNTPPEVALYSVLWHEENKEILAEARRKIRRPSQGKVEIWPETIRKIIYVDPLTQEYVYGNTWVSEHTRPKLTPEQELEIVLWQRSYRSMNTSSNALSVLEKYRPLTM